MGSASPRSSDWTFLRNRDVTIAPDNDTIGAKYANTLKDILRRVEAKSVKGFDVKKLGRYNIELIACFVFKISRSFCYAT